MRPDKRKKSGNIFQNFMDKKKESKAIKNFLFKQQIFFQRNLMEKKSERSQKRKKE